MEKTNTLEALRQALEPYFAGGVWKDDKVPVFQAVGRYLAEDISGTEDLPSFDLQKEQIDFKIGHRLTVSDIGILAALGKTVVSVWYKPYVTILVTGEELVTPFEAPDAGQLRDANSVMLSALVDFTGARVVGVDMIREGRDAVDQAIRSAADHSDVVIVTTSMLEGAEAEMLAMTDNIRKPGVIAYGSFISPEENLILAALKDDYCRCVGRMPALIACLPSKSAHLQRHYAEIVDYFLRKYYFHNL